MIHGGRNEKLKIVNCEKLRRFSIENFLVIKRKSRGWKILMNEVFLKSELIKIYFYKQQPQKKLWMQNILSVHVSIFFTRFSFLLLLSSSLSFACCGELHTNKEFAVCIIYTVLLAMGERLMMYVFWYRWCLMLSRVQTPCSTLWLHNLNTEA